MAEIQKTIPPADTAMILQDLGGGALKRLGENRELLELLQAKVPELLQTHPHVIGWLKANDEVFEELAVQSAALGMRERFARRPNFPRPWPISQVRDNQKRR